MLASQHLHQVVGQALRLEADAGQRVRDPYRLRIGRANKPGLKRRSGPEALFAHLAQQVAHVHGHVTEVDIHRAWAQALVTHRAMVGDVFKLFPMLDADAAPGLLFVQEGLHQQRGREDLVARAVQQVGSRHMRGAHRFAFTAAQAILDGAGNIADIALLHDQRFVAHEAKARGIGVGQVSRKSRVAQELALVEAALRIDAVLVVRKRLQLFGCQKVQFGDANAVLARDHAIQRTRQHHDARHGMVRGLQHFIVIAVDRQVGVHIAVASMHMERGPHTPFENLLVNDVALLKNRGKRGT